MVFGLDVNLIPPVLVAWFLLVLNMTGGILNFSECSCTRLFQLFLAILLLQQRPSGIDPGKSTIFIQSQVHELYELSMHLLNLVTVSRLERNPTIKEEILLRGFERDIPAGFLT